MFSPLTRVLPFRYPEAGSVRPDVAGKILNAYLLSFFRRHLLAQNDGLFDRPKLPFPEVELERLFRGRR